MDNNFEFFVKPESSEVSELERVEFYKKTYLHVALGVLAFIVIEYLFLHTETIVNFAMSLTQGKMWLLMLGGFMLATNYAENMAIRSTERNKQYIGYFIYIVAEAFIFVPILYIASNFVEGEVIKQAAVLTMSLFTGLSAVVFVTKKDFSFLRTALMVGGFIAIGLIVAGLLFGFNLGLWFSVGMIILASGSILYQTSNLLRKYRTDQYVAAALGLFASLMLLFWYILRILMSRK
jgi:FtsH-binding integral membrane protein